MKNKIAFILLNVALILLITAIPGQFIFEGNSFDLYYAISTSAGICLLLISFAVYRDSWGVVPIAVIFWVIALYFSIDFSILDDFVKTRNAGIFIIIISTLCYVYSLIQWLWRR